MNKIQNSKSCITQSREKKIQKRIGLVETCPYCDLIQILSLIVFLTLIFVDRFYFHLFPTVQNLFPWYIRLILAVPFFIVAILISKKGITIIYGEIRDPPCVIKRGIFRYSRHPIYFGALLAYLGIIIASFSILGIIYYIGIIVLYTYFTRYEERVLIQNFGEEYKKYKEEVLRWIGRSR